MLKFTELAVVKRVGLFALLMLLIISFTSCAEDSSAVPEEMQGSWSLAGAQINKDGYSNNYYSKYEMSSSGVDTDISLDINDDGTFSLEIYSNGDSAETNGTIEKLSDEYCYDLNSKETDKAVGSIVYEQDNNRILYVGVDSSDELSTDVSYYLEK